MCEKTSVLIIFLIIKIIVLLLIPAAIIYFKIKYRNENKKVLNILFIIEVLSLLTLIILKITNNSCVINSSISTIGRLNGIDSTTTKVVADTDSEEILYVLPEIVKTKDNKQVLYYNNAKTPLSDKLISCNKEIYMKNFGSSMTALASLVSTAKGDVINPVDILNLALDKKIIDCDKGVEFEALKNAVQSKYNLIIKEISLSEIDSNVSKGNVVLEKTKYNPNAINLTCNEGFIMIYDKESTDKYNIINTNKKPDLVDYICPETTPGKYTTIKYTASDSYTLDELSMMGTNFYVVEGVN